MKLFLDSIIILLVSTLIHIDSYYRGLKRYGVGGWIPEAHMKMIQHAIKNSDFIKVDVETEKLLHVCINIHFHLIF